MADAIETHLAGQPSDVQAICLDLRATAQGAMPDAHERWYHGSICYSLSASRFEPLCYIAPMRGYVNLGFFFGSHLDDPERLLEGTGTRMRHVKVRTLAEARDPALARLLEAAWLDGPASIAQLKQKRRRSS